MDLISCVLSDFLFAVTSILCIYLAGPEQERLPSVVFLNRFSVFVIVALFWVSCPGRPMRSAVTTEKSEIR